MTKLFDSQYGTRMVQIWHAAATHLLHAPKRTDANLILEISNPLGRADSDRQMLNTVDDVLRNSPTQCGLSIDTVASTIFPENMYRRYGRPGMYKKVLEALDRGGKPGSWGTYTERMISRSAKDGFNTINPLDLLVEKLKANAHSRHAFKSAYELSMPDPEADLIPILDTLGDGGDLPTYNPTYDAKLQRGGPCLSLVSVKLAADSKVNLTAIYRAHHYCSRALGNLLGLIRLQNFIAKEADLEIGTFTCISTYATLDCDTWGGVARTKEILSSYKPD